MAIAVTPRVGPVLGRTVPGTGAGPLTWAVAVAASCTLLGVSLDSGSGLAFVASAASIAFMTAFVMRPLWGLAAVIAARPTLDAWANSSVLGVPGHRQLNAGSLMAVLVIAVGGAYLLEHWSAFRRAPCWAPFLAFAAIAAFSVPFSPAKSFGAQEVLRLLAVVVIYGIAFVSVRRTRDMAILAGAVVGSALVPAVVALYQSVVVGVVAGKRGFGRAHGTFVTVDGLGIFMALVITFATPLALTRRIPWRWMLWLASPLAVAALVSSYGRTGWAASVVGLMIVGITRYRWMVFVVPVALVAVAVAVPSTTARVSDLQNSSTKYGPGNTFNGRVQMWKAALPDVEKRPVVGKGFGSIAVTAKRQVANDYVRSLVETGIPGLLVYVWLLLACLWAAYKGMLMARHAGDPLAGAITLGSFAAVPAYMLMSADSNLMTQVVIAGGFWSMAACAHAFLVHDWEGMRP